MYTLLTPDLEIDEGKVNSAAMKETVRLRNDGVPWALEVAFGTLYRRQKVHFMRAAERDRGIAINEQAKLRRTLRESVALEVGMALHREMHGLAMGLRNNAEVARLQAILADLYAQEAAQLQAAE